MRRAKSGLLKVQFEEKSVTVASIICRAENTFDEKELRRVAAKFVLDGLPTLCVNATEDGLVLLSGEKEYFALVFAAVKTANVKIYRFTDAEAEIFTVAEQIKTGNLSAMDEAYAMKRLVQDYGCTQETVAALTGKSRPAVANTLRLLTLSPEVVGLIESGALSAGHARALVRMPQEKQYDFALAVIEKKFTVRDTEKAAQAFLGEEKSRARKNGGGRDELKAFVARLREVLKTKVTLIGSEEKGKIVVEYYSREDLYRFEELLERL
ncbi:MAG: ParB/RepB/Spo0J family partition protein [Clostridia bacterium]|nr:ParB/RepB/Spo0J family partition protein [Clostridia bacterium]